MEIDCSWINNKYVVTLLKNNNFGNLKPANMTIAEISLYSNDNRFEDGIGFHWTFEGLQYLMMSWPNIAHVMNKLSQFSMTTKLSGIQTHDILWWVFGVEAQLIEEVRMSIWSILMIDWQLISWRSCKHSTMIKSSIES